MPTLEERLKTRPIADPHMKALLNILVTSTCLESKFSALLKPHGLTEPQFNVLRILRGQQGKSMNLYEIGERMVHPTSNVSRIIDKLLEKGWVTRDACEENRRRVDIAITAQGLKALEAVQPDADLFFKAIAARITAEDAERVSEVLQTMCEV